MNKYYAIPIVAVIVISISLVWYVSNDYHKYEDSKETEYVTEQPAEQEEVKDNSVIPKSDNDYTEHNGESYDFDVVAEMLAEQLAEDEYSEEEIKSMIENNPDMVYEFADDAGITILE